MFTFCAIYWRDHGLLIGGENMFWIWGGFLRLSSFGERGGERGAGLFFRKSCLLVVFSV